MCDYSLYAIPNRLAVEQEELTCYRFQTGSMGLASPCDIEKAAAASRRESKKGFWSAIKEMLAPPAPPVIPAVCVPPGARLVVKDIPARIQQDLGVGPEEEVTFVQTSAVANTYRDAVRFTNGRVLGLQELKEGQRVQILSLADADTSGDRLDWEQIESLEHSPFARAR